MLFLILVILSLFYEFLEILMRFCQQSNTIKVGFHVIIAGIYWDFVEQLFLNNLSITS